MSGHSPAICTAKPQTPCLHTTILRPWLRILTFGTTPVRSRRRCHNKLTDGSRIMSGSASLLENTGDIRRLVLSRARNSSPNVLPRAETGARARSPSHSKKFTSRPHPNARRLAMVCAAERAASFRRMAHEESRSPCNRCCQHRPCRAGYNLGCARPIVWHGSYRRRRWPGDVSQ